MSNLCELVSVTVQPCGFCTKNIPLCVLLACTSILSVAPVIKPVDQPALSPVGNSIFKIELLAFVSSSKKKPIKSALV
jgi:hypothetical protein